MSSSQKITGKAKQMVKLGSQATKNPKSKSNRPGSKVKGKQPESSSMAEPTVAERVVAEIIEPTYDELTQKVKALEAKLKRKELFAETRNDRNKRRKLLGLKEVSGDKEIANKTTVEREERMTPSQQDRFMEHSEGTLAMLTLDAQGGEPRLSTPNQPTDLLELIIPDSVEPEEFAIELSSPTSPKRTSSDEEFVANTPDRESTPPITGWELAIVPVVPTPTQSDIRLSAELNEGMEFVRRDEDLNMPQEEVRENSPRPTTPISQPQNQRTPQPKKSNKPATTEAGPSRTKKKPAVRKTNQLTQKELRMLDAKRAIVNEQLSKITKKPVLQEQGFAEDLSRYLPTIRFEIEQRSWGEFCIVWEEARIEWVYEFFANIFKRDSHVSYVQGRRIFWNSRAWNKMYGLEDVESDYEVLMETCTDEDRDDCIKTICREGAKWDEGLKAKRIIASDLTNEAKFWAAFVRTCLMPTTHETTLTVPRAMLIYCIMAGHSINIGKIIEDEIYQWASGGKKACRIIFPHAISMLLATQGVQRTPNDVKLTKKKPLAPPKQKSAPSKQTPTKPCPTPIRNPTSPPANPSSIPSLSEDLLTQILAEQRDMKTRQLAFYKYYAELEKVEQTFFDMIENGPSFPPFPSWVLDPNSLGNK